MWSQVLIGVGGFMLLALVFVLAQVISARMRAMAGDCKFDSVRCLGCLATGRCRATKQSSGAPPAPASRAKRNSPSTFNSR